MQKQVACIFRILLGIIGTFLVGYESLIVRWDYGFAGIVAPFCCLVFAMLTLDIFLARDKSGLTWCERYHATSGVLIGQLIIGIGSFWCAAADMIEIFVSVGCGPCKDYSLDSLTIRDFFKLVYYFHVVPCFLVGALGPLQFYEPMRKYSSFCMHRWIGRLLLVGSVFQQLTATIMITMYMWKGLSLLNRVYHASLYVLNVYAWIAIIFGWLAGVRKDIPAHGAHMHRLGAGWCAIVVGYRIVQAPLARALGDNDWAGAVAGWVIDAIFIVPNELYLHRSGRFASPQLSARCPLTGETGKCQGRQLERTSPPVDA